MQGDIVAQGVELMLYGMGTVVVFLALLVLATAVMSRLMARYYPEPEPAVRPAPRRAQAQAGRAPAEEDPNLVAAISAAVHRYRAGRK